ncbi:MAG: metallophosphoesterase [Bacteroides sp.]|nr:metallophosphoesterase [Bacteroides sp.]MDD2645788.1 metallophosphoesterase [Bacteroides sp.]NLI65044.1 hypothetical protein [Bacteroidales bacterium]
MKVKNSVILLVLLLFVSLSGLYAKNKKLRFAFMTDIHLNKENSNDRYNGLQQALDKAEKSNVDFILLGGDVFDISGMGSSLEKSVADSLYKVYKQIFEERNISFYPTLGNHDRLFNESIGYVEGDELFKSYFGESYYKFEQKGVHFFVLNSVQNNPEGGYYINKKQLEWLKKELSELSSSDPVVLSTHVPFYSLYYPLVENRYVFLDVITNYKEVLDVLKDYNIQLVLQGHQHIHEEILLQNIQFITGGAVCANWWNGPFYGTKEGFLLVEIDKQNKFTWEYVSYGWEAKK